MDDLGQPWSCEQWGESHEVENPVIIDGQSCLNCNNNYPIFNWFGYAYTDYVFIDHNMKVYYLHNSISSNLANSIIQDMLDGIPSYGDINDDGELNILDLVQIATLILDNGYDAVADINEDGELNILDLVVLVNWILGGVLDDTVTDIDGNVYETMQVGAQLWMAENLKVTHFNNGDEIPTGYSTSEWYTIWDDAYAVYDDDPSNVESYGNLYNWFAIDDSRGICPESYHIPTDDEWYVLLEYLGGDTGENWIIAGGKMKDEGIIEDGDGMWYAPNEGANNESDFTAIPAGFRLNDGQYYEGGYYGIFWSSTAEYYTNAFFMWYLLHDESRLYRGLFGSQTGLSVRCLKD